MYTVIELQTDGTGATAALQSEHSTLNEAYSKMHTVLGYAAVSESVIHSAVILDERGRRIDGGCRLPHGSRGLK